MRAFEKVMWPLTAALVLACSPAEDAEPPAGEAEGAPPEVSEEVSEEQMSGWNVDLDEEAGDPSGFQMVTEEGGFIVQTGPAGIAWRSVDLLEQGDYTVSATFTEMGAPADHREAYGIVVGGKHLESPDQVYSYFLVRGDGSYLIKRRVGDETRELVGWTSSDVVEGVETEGEESPNRLAVRVRGDRVEFSVNDTVVETLPASEVEPWGFAGLRINHNLDVRVSDWSAEGAGGEMGAATDTSG